MSPLLPVLIASLGAAAAGATPAPAKHALAPPQQVKVPEGDAKHPLLSNPQITLDGKRVFVARVGPPQSGLTQGLNVLAIPLAADAKAETIHFPIQVNGNRVKLLLSRDDKYLAVLSEGELWLDRLGEKADPHRLYPPAEGDAPLGPSLSQAAFATDSTWILADSPTGWGRISVKGEFGALPLHPIDLKAGSLDMSPDAAHCAFVRPQEGQGYLNGSHALATNITTAFTQGLDIEHLYTDVLFLPDGHLLGKDSGGQLWVLQPKGRLAYFEPPGVRRGASVDGYAINFAATKLAWVLTSGLGGKTPKAELWIAGAPPTPAPPKAEKPEED
jgi:hypothetical protein